MAEDIRARGQVMPCLGHQLPDKRVRLTAGDRRRRAMIRLNQGLPPDKQMRLQVVVQTFVEGEERDVYFAGLAENVQRKNLSDMDIALVARTATEKYGQSLEEVAALFPNEQGGARSKSWVQQHLDLLALGRDIQVKVHRGELPYTVALTLVRNVAPEKREEVLQRVEEKHQEAREEAPASGKALLPAKRPPKAREVIAEARQAKALTQKVGRKLAEVKDDHISMTGPGEPKPVREFAEVFLNYIDGTLEFEEYEETVHRLLAVEAPKRRKEARER